MWLWLLFFLPLVTLWLFSFIHPIYVAGRYDMVAYPAFPLLVGLAMAKGCHLGRLGSPLVTLAALCLFVPTAAKLVLYYQAPPEEAVQPEATAQVLDKFAENGDVVVLTDLRVLPVIYYLHRLGYTWKEGQCDNQSANRHFACHTFPHETEKHPSIYDPSPVLQSANAVHDDVQGFVRELKRPDSRLWLVLGTLTNSRGELEVSLADTLLLLELKRSGLRQVLVPTDAAPGIVSYTRLEQES